MAECTVMAIKIEKRSEFAPKVQEILTRFGRIIKARLGLHELPCDEEGFILLVVCGSKEERNALSTDLASVPTVRAFLMDI